MDADAGQLSYRDCKHSLENLSGKGFPAFLSSSAAIAGLMLLVAIGMFPNLVIARQDPSLSRTIYNAASSPKTSHIMLIIAIIGMPLVVAHTTSNYYIFHGKTKLDPMSD